MLGMSIGSWHGPQNRDPAEHGELRGVTRISFAEETRSWRRIGLPEDISGRLSEESASVRFDVPDLTSEHPANGRTKLEELRIPALLLPHGGRAAGGAPIDPLLVRYCLNGNEVNRSKVHPP